VDRWSKNIQGLLLPARCLLCLDPGQWPVLDLCAACQRALPWNRSACPGCALPLPVGTPAGAHCAECQRGERALTAARAPLHYAWPVAPMIHRCKYGRDLAQGRVLGSLLAQAVADRAMLQPTLLPVPLHRSRELERGFNQAELLARRVGRELGLRVAARLLRRTRATQAQAGLAAADRHANVRGAFELVAALPPGPLALVDDVMTTGQTLEEIARLLLTAGASHVEAWVVARAG
jgi:ComF family protein